MATVYRNSDDTVVNAGDHLTNFCGVTWEFVTTVNGHTKVRMKSLTKPLWNEAFPPQQFNVRIVI